MVLRYISSDLELKSAEMAVKISCIFESCWPVGYCCATGQQQQSFNKSGWIIFKLFIMKETSQLRVYISKIVLRISVEVSEGFIEAVF